MKEMMGLKKFFFWQKLHFSQVICENYDLWPFFSLKIMFQPGNLRKLRFMTVFFLRKLCFWPYCFYLIYIIKISISFIQFTLFYSFSHSYNLPSSSSLIFSFLQPSSFKSIIIIFLQSQFKSVEFFFAPFKSFN